MNLEGVKTMEVEIEGEDGSKFAIGPQKILFGRGSGINTNDGTVSRRHVCLQLSEGGRVSFEVIGRNPIWVCSYKDQSLKLFRKFEKGDLEFGDRFSLSAKTPIWFHLSHRETGGSTSSRLDLDLDIDQIDLSQIDPVKEFGFLVIGHEFDQYPKGKIKNVKDWEWFLDEASKDSDEDDEDEGKKRRKMKRKRKKVKDNDEDEEWGGESEDDKDIVSKIRKGKGPRYSTRSKDNGKGSNRGTKGGGGGSSSGASSKQKKTTEEEEDGDDDETLGGFIVDDEDDKEEDDDDDEEEEEEEFEDEEEDDED